MRPLADINKSPFPDFSIFEDFRFYRPFHGQVVRMAIVDTDRGCPYTCTYCAAPSLREKFQNDHLGCYFRIKSIDKIIKETKYIVKKYKINFIWFSSETFFARSQQDIEEFSSKYIREINLPFWCQTRLDTFTDSKTKLLAKMGCKAVSLGLEHGNEEFRKTVLKKFIPNSTILKSVKLLSKYNISATVNNIVGFPDETRKLVFDTIDLNRRINPYLPKDSTLNVFVFTPFTGTPLRQLCVDKGYLQTDNIDTFMYFDSIISMPSMSSDEIKGLAKTFPLYVKLPKKLWPEIKKAEKNSPEGNRIYQRLSRLLTNQS